MSGRYNHQAILSGSLFNPLLCGVQWTRAEGRENFDCLAPRVQARAEVCCLLGLEADKAKKEPNLKLPGAADGRDSNLEVCKVRTTNLKMKHQPQTLLTAAAALNLPLLMDSLWGS